MNAPAPGNTPGNTPGNSPESDPFEAKLKTVAPSSPSMELRDRIDQDLNPTSSSRWKIGVAAMITSMAAAIVLMFTLNTGTLTTPTPELANKDGKGADAKQLVLTFPIAEEPEAPVAGNWDPYMLRYLVPHADVVLYGKVTKGDKKAEVKFTVHEVLRGKLATLKIDATQTRWRFGGCGPELARWPVGEFCCVYLNYDAKKKTYKFIESGVPIQTLPYKQTLGVDHLREIISVWDAEFAGKTEEQQKKHRETLKEREQLVFDLLTSNYKDHYAHIKKLKEMGGKKKAGKSKPVDADVVNEGKVK